jgi:hypothetical protein
MKISTIVGLLSVLLLASPVNAEVTLKSFKATKSAGGHQWDLMRIYLDGVSNGLGYANAALISEHKTPLFCQPGNLKINMENLTDIIDQTVARANPPLGNDVYVEGLILFGLQYTFPCNHQ